MSERVFLHFDVEFILRETDKAFLLHFDDGREFWVPKSQISDADDYSEGDEDCTVSITEWFCEKEGIES